MGQSACGARRHWQKLVVAGPLLHPLPIRGQGVREGSRCGVLFVLKGARKPVDKRTGEHPIRGTVLGLENGSYVMSVRRSWRKQGRVEILDVGGLETVVKQQSNLRRKVREVVVDR
jgi:hypothetical protein